MYIQNDVVIVMLLLPEIFYHYLSYIDYKERPTWLLINKYTHDLYTKSHLCKQDKITYERLSIILNNTKFFNVLLGCNYGKIIKKTNGNFINLLYIFVYTEREIIEFENNRFLPVPLRWGCQSDFDIWGGEWHYNEFPCNVMSIICLDSDVKHICYNELFLNYKIHYGAHPFNLVFLTEPQIRINKNGHVHMNVKNLKYAKYETNVIPDECIASKISEDIVNSYNISKINKQKTWDIFVDTMNDDKISNVLKLLEHYFIK